VNDRDGIGRDGKQEAANLTVYVVEDSPIITRLLTELIETAGALVVGHAATASQAVGEIWALHPDVVTIDIGLKSGTGYDVLEGILINCAGHPPTRMMLTNHTSDVYREAAWELGAECFFDKAKEIRDALTVVELIAEEHWRLRAALALRETPSAVVAARFAPRCYRPSSFKR
jgi:DNA-binding NarL/FixJ family response regulator